jgi:tryptophan-rich sensory protein
MRRERALKIVLAVVGLLFTAAIYPLILMLKQDPALAMMMSLYATLGVFLLLASRNPSAHRSLIAFAAWSSFAHATVMGVQAYLNLIARRELFGVATFFVIGVALIALAPAKQRVQRASVVVA